MVDGGFRFVAVSFQGTRSRWTVSIQTQLEEETRDPTLLSWDDSTLCVHHATGSTACSLCARNKMNELVELLAEEDYLGRKTLLVGCQNSSLVETVFDEFAFLHGYQLVLELASRNVYGLLDVFVYFSTHACRGIYYDVTAQDERNNITFPITGMVTALNAMTNSPSMSSHLRQESAWLIVFHGVPHFFMPVDTAVKL